MIIQKPNRSGFTLIELLVVIAIIGLLAGLIVPAVMGAVKSAQQGAYKLEVDTLAEAVEKYRSKYGDYPPDGSNWNIMERHLRKAFPQILQSEINLLSPVAPIASGIQVHNHFAGGGTLVMDPAEALVFFLGGFSADPQRPFTGVGGPFAPTSVANGLQYNVQRTNPFFEFQTSRLSLVQIPNPASIGETISISNDDGTYFGIANDILPVYLSQALDVSETSPFVYFDSRTYAFGPGTIVNYYQRAPANLATSSVSLVSSGTLDYVPESANPGVRFGAVRPLISETLRTPQVAVTSPITLDWIRRYLFMNDKTFQVIGPGQDGIYGGRLGSEVNIAIERNFCEALITYPNGNSFVPSGVPGASSNFTFDRWRFLNGLQDPSIFRELVRRTAGLEDNAANFSERTFAQSTPVGS